MPGKKYDLLFTDEEKEKMRLDYKNGASIRDIERIYNIKCRNWIQKNLLKGLTRNFSEANSLTHKKYPDRFKHTEEYKAKMREIRLKYMAEHPESTAWRKRNEPSYPEKCFIKFLVENGYDKKYLIEREKSVFPFYIDFAFTPGDVAVEIDGSQHITDEERMNRDKKKDETLLKNGWKVLRVSENIVKTDWSILKEKLDYMLGNNTTQVEKVGIFRAPKTKEKVKRGKDGLSDKMRANNYKQRKVKNRPSFEELEEMRKTMSLTKIGEKYDVTESAVRKWIKQYKKNA